jgi:allantoin racemase
MKLKIINPNTMEAMTRDINESARRVAGPDTEFVTVNPTKGPLSLEGWYDSCLATPEMLGEIIRAKEKYDAVIIACFGDPGLEAAREIVDVPVIGICEAALHVASMLAPRFSILTVIPRVINFNQNLVYKYGFERQLASIRTTDLPVEKFARDRVAAQKALTRAGRLAIDEDRAEALLLGCAGMAGLDEVMEQQLGVPVIDGVAAAVKLAEAIVGLGKKTSKINSYKYPEKKEFKGMEEIFQL